MVKTVALIEVSAPLGTKADSFVLSLYWAFLDTVNIENIADETPVKIRLFRPVKHHSSEYFQVK